MELPLFISIADYPFMLKRILVILLCRALLPFTRLFGIYLDAIP